MARKTQKTAPKGKAAKVAEKTARKSAPVEDEMLTTKDLAAAVGKSTARVREVLRQDEVYADGKYTPYRWTEDSKEYRRVVALFEDEDEEPAPKPKKAAKAKAEKPAKVKKGKKARKPEPEPEELEDLEDALEEEDEEDED